MNVIRKKTVQNWIRQEKNEKSGSAPPSLPSGYMKKNVVGPNGFEPATTRTPFT
jgi:hypothetical protein